MAKILRSADCGNSPKNKFAQEISIALASGNVEFLTAGVAYDATWRLVGLEEMTGSAALTAAAAAMPRPKKITIQHVMTHGKVGAVNGAMSYPTGEVREFCDVIEFTGASGRQVQSIISYVIKG